MRTSVPGLRPALQSVAMLVSVAVLLAGGGCCISRATHPQPLPGGVERQWSGAASDQPMTLTVFRPAKVPTNTPLPVVFYLQNLAVPRVGWENDASIVRDFRAKGYLVVTVDFDRHTNARMPFINRDLGKLRDDVRAKQLLGDFNVDMAHVFIVPAGCRLKRDVVFHRDAGRTLALDIIYPSKPKRPVGTVLEFSCDNKDRFGNYSLSVCSDTLLDGFATEGFAVAMADHPVAPPYKGLDPMPDAALKIKAAVRTLRVEGEKLGFNDRIVPVGFSRGSGMALMLVTTAGMEQFEGAGENAGVSSDVQGAVVMSGRFTYLDLLADDKMLPRYSKAWGERTNSLETWRAHGALDYLKPLTRPLATLSPSDGKRDGVRGVPPLFLTINCTESPDALHQMEVLQRRLKELDSRFEFHMDMEPRGHKVTLDPQILDAMRNYLGQCLRHPDGR
jgi:hypothetical protein